VWHEATAIQLAAADQSETDPIETIAQNLLRFEIAGELHLFNNWDRVIESYRLKQRVDNDRACLHQREKRAFMTDIELKAVNARRAELYEVKKKVVVAVRWCQFCKEPYEVRAVADDAQRYCTTECALHGRAKFFTVNGRTQGLNAWCAELGIAPKTVRDRLKRGFSIEDAFSRDITRDDPRHNRARKIPLADIPAITAALAAGEPKASVAARYGVHKSAFKAFLKRRNVSAPKRVPATFTLNGEAMTLPQWSERRGLKYTTVFYRMNRHGWTLEEALEFTERKGGK